MESDAADQALANESHTQRLDLEIEFENRRYQIAYDALQERGSHLPSKTLDIQSERNRQAETAGGCNLDKQRVRGETKAREQQRRKDAPSSEMLTDAE